MMMLATANRQEPLPSGKLYDLAIQRLDGSDGRLYSNSYIQILTSGSSTIYVLKIPKGANRCKITSNSAIAFNTISYGFFTNIYPIEPAKIYYSNVKPIGNFYIKEIEFEINHSYNYIAVPARRYEALVGDRYVEFFK